MACLRVLYSREKWLVHVTNVNVRRPLSASEMLQYALFSLLFFSWPVVLHVGLSRGGRTEGKVFQWEY